MTILTAPAIETDVVIVSGVDAGEYLQTQLTQDVLALEPGASAWSFLLKPKSEILALMRVTRSAANEYTLEVESGWGDAVRQTLDEFLGRMDISFEQATVHVEGEHEEDRIARGWPRMGKEIDGSVTPAMTGVIPETISFDKGCYTGQEFVARVHYRGVAPPKRLVHLAYEDNVSLPEGSPIVVDGDEVGTVTSSGNGRALGYLKRGIKTPAHGSVGDVNVQISDTPTSEA